VPSEHRRTPRHGADSRRNDVASGGGLLHRGYVRPITEVVVSNTVPIPAEKMAPKFRVPSIGQPLASAIPSVHEGSSVSQIFF
jgi:phosphoribosylpyrophosphate synthetase